MISITADERHTEYLDNDTKIITTADKSVKWCFISKKNYYKSLNKIGIINKEYPERIGYSMLAELQNKCIKKLISKIFSTENDNIDNVKPEVDNMQLNMVEIYRKYNNPAQIDTLWSIKNDVNDIKINMKKNMNTMISNVTELSVINYKIIILL